jgi:peptidyl-prolyl cis-trans isomerase C
MMKLQFACLAMTMVLASSFANAAAPKPAAKAGASEASTGPAVAKVNNVAIPTAFAELLMNDQIAQGAPNNEDLRKATRDELIRRELLAQEAKKSGLDRRADVVARIELARQGILLGAYVNEWSKSHPVTEDKIRAEYDRRVGLMSGTEYHISQIQTDKIEDAQAVITKLQNGTKFADLAKDVSVDAGSKENGGEMGWFTPQVLPKTIGDAITKLEKGKFTTVPVQSQYGYHVILVQDTRQATPPKYEDQKENLRQALAQQALVQYTDELIKKAKIE